MPKRAAPSIPVRGQHLSKIVFGNVAPKGEDSVDQLQKNLACQLAAPVIDLRANMVRELAAPIAELQRSLVAHAQLNVVRETHLTVIRQLATPVADLQRSILGQLTVNFQFKALAQLSQSFGLWNTRVAIAQQFPASPAYHAEPVTDSGLSNSDIEQPIQILGEVSISRFPLADSTSNVPPVVSHPSWLRQHDTEVIVILAALTFLIAVMAWLFPQQSTDTVSPNEVQQIVKSILKAESSGYPAPHSCRPSDKR